MLTAYAHRQHRSTGFRVASAACTMMTMLSMVGVTRPVTAEDRIQPPPYNRRVLSEIARDVLRRGAAGANPSVAEPSLPGGMSGLKPEPDATAANTEPAEAMTATDIAPAPEGITVPIDPRGRERQKPSPGELKPAGYHSNSGRQRTDTGRGLSFSSGAWRRRPGSTRLSPPTPTACAPRLASTCTAFSCCPSRSTRPSRGSWRGSTWSCSARTMTTTRPVSRSRRSKGSRRCRRWSGSACARSGRS